MKNINQRIGFICFIIGKNNNNVVVAANNNNNNDVNLFYYRHKISSGRRSKAIMNTSTPSV